MFFKAMLCVEYGFCFASRQSLERVVEYKTWLCEVCGYIYSEEVGDADHGLVPGTRWQDVPEDWECPDCSAGKDDFQMVEV